MSVHKGKAISCCVREAGFEVSFLGLRPGSITHTLHNLGKVASRIFVPCSSSVKWGQ